MKVQIRLKRTLPRPESEERVHLIFTLDDIRSGLAWQIIDDQYPDHTITNITSDLLS